jgi:(E)-4-hydroxy-3-methylbut-2-enyl-diphosphate synthase
LKKRLVSIGNIVLGEGNVVVQTMTNTSTKDIKSTVNQIIQLIETGAEMVRITVPSLSDVMAINKIKKEVRAAGFQQPLIADVHFQSEVAYELAPIVDKIRINPGNYSETKNSSEIQLTENEYRKSLEKMSLKAQPLLERCKLYETALRIGVNHGSLCNRIINRYGNGAQAMSMSALEWITICEANNFTNMVFSMKSSNVVTMMEATLLLQKEMTKRGSCYPLHLGVTEAGAGLDGRVKSAIGIGGLLLQGIGDTIRVSLTEPPEMEIPFAKTLVKAVANIQHSEPLYQIDKEHHTVIFNLNEPDLDLFTAKIAAICGKLLSENQLQNIAISNPHFAQEICQELEMSILQGCRLKMSKTEIISCPTCGRTQYDLTTVLEEVKKRFSHHPGLKLGVMGCVVNGPGEMTDAHFGIVGASNNNMVVYKGKEKISKAVTMEEALLILEKVIDNW